MNFQTFTFRCDTYLKIYRLEKGIHWKIPELPDDIDFSFGHNFNYVPFNE